MSQEIIRLPTVESRHYQYNFWTAMDSGCNRAVKSWHRRAGKDITDFQFVVRAAIRRPGTYYYYFPTLELAKKALWDNIVEFYTLGECVAAGNMIDILCPVAIRESKSNSEHFIRLKNGSIIKLGGTDNLSVIGMNGYGYVFSEWQSQKKEAFGYISPILRENGGWALFNGTMRGKKNHLYTDIHANLNNPSWFAEWLTPNDTKEYYWINEDEGISINPELEGMIHHHTLRPYQNIQDLVDAGEISFTLARQEYLNDAVSQVGGSYYSYEIKALRKRSGILSIDPFKNPVYTIWDLGGVQKDSDKTCIVFVQMNDCDGEVKIVDYYENTGHLRGHYFDVINRKNYNYAGHYLPHDAKKRNEFTGENMLETARKDHNIEMRIIPKTDSVADDIEITRKDFVNYSFDELRTEDLITHVTNYHESETTQKPCHRNNCSQCGGASHGADTVRQVAMARHLGLIEPYLAGNNQRYRTPQFVQDTHVCM